LIAGAFEFTGQSDLGVPGKVAVPDPHFFREGFLLLVGTTQLAQVIVCGFDAFPTGTWEFSEFGCFAHANVP
jgi:hypothetical protein